MGIVPDRNSLLYLTSLSLLFCRCLNSYDIGRQKCKNYNSCFCEVGSAKHWLSLVDVNYWRHKLKQVRFSHIFGIPDSNTSTESQADSDPRTLSLSLCFVCTTSNPRKVWKHSFPYLFSFFAVTWDAYGSRNKFSCFLSSVKWIFWCWPCRPQSFNYLTTFNAVWSLTCYTPLV